MIFSKHNLIIIFFLLFSAGCLSSDPMRMSDSLELKTGSRQIGKTINLNVGTGFLFGSSNYVVTSYHIVHGASSIQVKLFNGEKIDGELALEDTENDIALLKLDEKPRIQKTHIVFGNSSKVRTGEKVFTYGFPLVDLLGDGEPRYSEGIVNSLSGISNDSRMFQVSIPIQPGNSGGPIFNENNQLIGIASSSVDSKNVMQIFGTIPQNVNFAVKSYYIKKLLQKLPDAFLRDSGIMVVPNKMNNSLNEGFKERIKDDIVLVEAVPKFYREEEERVVEKDNSRHGDFTERESYLIKKEKELEERERKLNERQLQIPGKNVSVISSSDVAGFTNDDGYAAFDNQDYQKALAILKNVADRGNANAQHTVGVHYDRGLGVQQDHREAFKWFLIAARNNSPYAQYNVGIMYYKGLGVKKNYNAAVRWLKFAAGNGHKNAAISLRIIQGKSNDQNMGIGWDFNFGNLFNFKSSKLPKQPNRYYIDQQGKKRLRYPYGYGIRMCETCPPL